MVDECRLAAMASGGHAPCPASAPVAVWVVNERNKKVGMLVVARRDCLPLWPAEVRSRRAST